MELAVEAGSGDLVRTPAVETVPFSGPREEVQYADDVSASGVGDEELREGYLEEDEDEALDVADACRRLVGAVWTCVVGLFSMKPRPRKRRHQRPRQGAFGRTTIQPNCGSKSLDDAVANLLKVSTLPEADDLISWALGTATTVQGVEATMILSSGTPFGGWGMLAGSNPPTLVDREDWRHFYAGQVDIPIGGNVPVAASPIACAWRSHLVSDVPGNVDTDPDGGN